MRQKLQDRADQALLGFETGSGARKRYWDEVYLRYWQQRTRNDALPKGDKPTPDVSVFERYFRRMSPLSNDKVLEVGVGFGRLVPTMLLAGCRVYGIDICEAMIRETRVQVGNRAVELCEAEAETLPYAGSSFDHVVCWAVFDALHQSRTVREMVRVLKHGGRLLMTGKNDDYCDDDRTAYEAEIAAGSKNHPNYFTDFSALSGLLDLLGAPIQASWFFAKRGDLAQDLGCQYRPKRFYEYVVLASKVGVSGGAMDGHISSPHSQTFMRLKRGQQV